MCKKSLSKKKIKRKILLLKVEDGRITEASTHRYIRSRTPRRGQEVEATTYPNTRNPMRGQGAEAYTYPNTRSRNPRRGHQAEASTHPYTRSRTPKRSQSSRERNRTRRNSNVERLTPIVLQNGRISFFLSTISSVLHHIPKHTIPSLFLY